ncbi:MAG: CapA family protein [Rikenellaceae bacterium]
MPNLFIYFCLFTSFLSCKDRSEISQTKIIPSSCEPSKITIVFGGDVMAHLPQVAMARDTSGIYDFTDCFKYVKEYWKGADAVVLNLETTLSDRNFTGYPMFCSPYALAANLKESGVTHFVMANNHTCDKRAGGIDRTINFLDSIGVAHIGSFKDSVDWQHDNPLYIKKKGFNIALLNYTYGLNGLNVPKGKVVSMIDTTQMALDISKAKRGFATNVIVFLHWGEEYMREPNKEQIALSKWLRDKGVDIIIGSHPHVVQRFECDSSGVTVYSLGNFISNQQKRYTNGGINVKLILTKNNGKIDYNVSYRSFYVYVTAKRPSYFCVDEQSSQTLIKEEHKRHLAAEFFSDVKALMSKTYEK